jgi:hypothetical protein
VINLKIRKKVIKMTEAEEYVVNYHAAIAAWKKENPNPSLEDLDSFLESANRDGIINDHDLKYERPYLKRKLNL